ncbi:MAG: hypothetical protein HRT57_10485 [Crocinitomicaceae bacterium]|nr:hypothetical protein [Crocinitomicaceae bacterium]
MEQTPEERKKFLAELNETANYTAVILHGEEVSKVRIKQIKKYFKKTHKMLHRISTMKGDINNNSFKYGYGGKLLGRKVLLKLGVVGKLKTKHRKATYKMLLDINELDMELVSRVIVEVYLMRNEIEVM